MLLLQRSSNQIGIFIYEDCLLCLISKCKKQYEFKYCCLDNLAKVQDELRWASSFVQVC